MSDSNPSQMGNRTKAIGAVGLCGVTDGGGGEQTNQKQVWCLAQEMELWWSLKSSWKVGWEVVLEPT